MRTWKLWTALGVLAVVGGVTGTVMLSAAEDAGAAKEQQKVALPKPLEKADVDVLKAIRGRHSSRTFDAKKPIPDDVLATVLWAADGVNRANGKHTAPTAMGIRHMRLYLFRADGFYRYDQDKHELLTMGKEDLRSKVARQKFMADAQALVVLTSGLSAFETKNRKPPDAQRREWSHCAAGAIAQNIYLSAEAFGLGTVIAAGVNADEVRKALTLKAEEVPLYVMPLGYPKAGE